MTAVGVEVGENLRETPPRLASGEAEMLQAFETYERRRGLAEGTIYHRQRMLKALSGEIGNPLLATPGDIEAFIPDAPAKTRAWYLTMLSGFYKWAIREDLTSEDPTQKIERPKIPATRPRPARPQHIRQALAHADIRMALMISLGFHAGLRAGEIATLAWDDVYLDEEILHVNGKGNKERRVPIPAQLEARFRQYGIRDAGWVFPSRSQAGHLLPRVVSRMIAAHFRSLGFNVTAHTLRHSYGTELARRGVPLEVVQELMGHSNINTTRGYRAVSQSELEVIRGFDF